MAQATDPLVLVVEDEISQQAVLSYNLQHIGLRVAVADDGEEALAQVAESPPDLIILDWMLPELSGIEVCRRLKTDNKTRDIPIIMLSARSEEVDRIRGLDTGADDYVVKPYSVSELLARVKTNLRRTRGAGTGLQLTFGDVTLNGETHRVERAGQCISLGPKEFDLLATLMEKPGKVWSRAQLLDRVWGRDIHVDARTIDVHIGRLRKALGRHGGADLIRTVRGAGYALG
jgi:two-component system, OmpR family, phosphate regulon response regulator PhoB